MDKINSIVIAIKDSDYIGGGDPLIKLIEWSNKLGVEKKRVTEIYRKPKVNDITEWVMDFEYVE